MPKSTVFERAEMWLKYSEKTLFLFSPCHFPQKEEWQKRQKALTMR